MEKVKQTHPLVGLAARNQWNCFAVIVIIAVAIAAWRFALPSVMKSITDIGRIAKSYSLITKADSMEVITLSLKQRFGRLDSLMKEFSDTASVSQQAIPGLLYEIGAKAEIKTSKVEIGGRIALPEGAQIPVTLMAQGDYGACGRFIEGVERLKPAARIRDLDIKGGERGQLALTMNFVFLTLK